jgi:hypothetical protein
MSFHNAVFVILCWFFTQTCGMQHFENMAYCGYLENIAPFDAFKQLGL